MRKKYVISSVLFLVLFIFVISFYFVLKNRYERNYNRVYEVYLSGNVPKTMTVYYNSYNRMPEFLWIASPNGMDIHTFFDFWNREMKDWLSREPEEYPSYSYYRVYDRSTKEAVGFVVLSTGIDGKTDFILSENDTLYTDDYLKKIGVDKLYNPNSYYEIGGEGSVASEKPMPEFSLRDYFFGKKDLLLMYGNLKREKAHNDSVLKARNKCSRD